MLNFVKLSYRILRTWVKYACTYNISHPKRTNSGKQGLGSTKLCFTSLQELLTGLVKPAHGEVGGRREGRGFGRWTSMELEAHWPPATSVGGGRQRWKLIGLWGKGGKGEIAGSPLPPSVLAVGYRLAEGWGNHRLASGIGPLFSTYLSCLPPALGWPTPSPLLHLSGVPPDVLGRSVPSPPALSPTPAITSECLWEETLVSAPWTLAPGNWGRNYAPAFDTLILM